MIAIDFETYLISKEAPVPKPVCLSYYRDGEKGIKVGMEDMKNFLFEILTCSKPIIAHNMRFEAQVIDIYFPDFRDLLYRKLDAGELKCTKVNEQLLDNFRKKQLYRADLATLVKHYFKVDISEDKKNPDSWRMRYCELDGVPLKDWPKDAIDYAIEDSVWAFKVHQEHLKLPIMSTLSVRADFYLNKMGTFGIEIDKSRVLTLKSEISEKLAPKYKKLEEVGLCSLQKTGKYKKNMNVFREYVKENVENPEFTAKGTISTSSESIEHYLAVKEDPIFRDYLDIMKYEKVLTAFVSRLEQADPLVRSNYKAVVSSGRTSSSTSKEYASVNIQQMPRSVPDVTWDIRNCFVPRKGYKICSIDYAGLELSSTAHQLSELTGRKDMLNTVNKGDSPVDMHSMFAYRIMNLKEKTKETYESFVANKKKAPYKDYRQLAKPINLGFPGGIGYDTMRSLLAREGINPKLVVLESAKFESSLTWKRSKARKEGYPVRIRRVGYDEYQLVYDELFLLKQELFSLYPDLEYFLSEGHKEYLTGESKMVKNEYGEWEREPMYAFEVGDFKRDWCMYTQVCNGLLMQSPAAIGAKRAMCKIINRFGNSIVVHPLAFIHDEIVFEVLDNDKMYAIIEDISEILIDEMQTILSSVRITVEAEVFDYWKKAGGFYERTYWKDAGKAELKSK